MAIFRQMQKINELKLVLAALPALLVPIAGTVMTDAPVIWPVSTLIYNLGLLYGFATVSRRAARIIAYGIVAAILFVIESSFFLSYYLQNAGFNRAFFYHIRSDLLHAGVWEYLPVLLGLMVCLFGFITAGSFALAKERSRKGRLISYGSVLLVFGLVISPPVKALVYHAGNHSPENRGDLFEDFSELLDSKVKAEFVRKEKPNVVLIYAESLEQRYFDEAVFPGLLPNLKKLREQSIDFTNITQGVGAEWTIAGIVASQCGYPLAGSHEVGGNDLSLFDEFMPKATCLGDILKKKGYHLTFIGGADPRFAGKGNFLRAHGYKEVLGLDDLLGSLEDKSYINSWGIFDDTLFDYAGEKLTTISRKKSPFLLTLLTLDNHGTSGHLSRSCGTYGSGGNSSLNSIHCSDLLISRFIEQIRSAPFSENTIIIVLSDHLTMRNQATPMLEASRMPNRLTFFVNTPDGKKEKNNNAGIHYDIAPTILDLIGYEIRGQMGFGLPLTRGPGYLPGKFGADGWKGQEAKLTAIGSTLWDNEVVLDKDGIEFTASNLALTMGGREFNLSSWGGSDIPASTLFIFDDRSLKLEKISSYPFDEGLSREIMSKALLQHKEKLALVIGRARNLPGFSDPRNHPDQWVFFCGKPGSELFSWGPIHGDFLVPFDLIQNLNKSRTESRIIRAREDLLKELERNSTIGLEG